MDNSKGLKSMANYMPPGEAKILTLTLQAQILAGLCANDISMAKLSEPSWEPVDHLVSKSRALLMALLADNGLYPMEVE